MNTMNCPNCGEKVPASHINIQKMTAVCPACDTVFSFDVPETQKAKRRKVKQPANLMLTESGVKLLDFGLAAPAIARPEQGEISQVETVHQPLTAAGMMIGTFQYMAPEQLEGREADERSDLFALGCVLYEMATGRRPFRGNARPGHARREGPRSARRHPLREWQQGRGRARHRPPSRQLERARRPDRLRRRRRSGLHRPSPASDPQASRRPGAR